MAVGLIDRLGRFVQVVKVAELVGDLGQGLGDSRTDGQLPIGDDAHNGHLQGLLHLTQQRGYVVVGGRQQAAGQEHLARETIAQDPEDFMADIRLEPIEGQDDPALRLRQAPQPRRIWEGEGDQFVIALQEIGDRPGRDSDTTRDSTPDGWSAHCGGGHSAACRCR